MSFALQARLPVGVCALMGEYLLPPLPPQLLELSKRWGRMVVAQTTRGELVIPIYTEEEATSCLGRFVAKTVTTRWSWELDAHEMLERGSMLTTSLLSPTSKPWNGTLNHPYVSKTWLSHGCG